MKIIIKNIKEWVINLRRKILKKMIVISILMMKILMMKRTKIPILKMIIVTTIDKWKNNAKVKSQIRNKPNYYTKILKLLMKMIQINLTMMIIKILKMKILKMINQRMILKIKINLIKKNPRKKITKFHLKLMMNLIVLRLHIKKHLKNLVTKCPNSPKTIRIKLMQIIKILIMTLKMILMMILGMILLL